MLHKTSGVSSLLQGKLILEIDFFIIKIKKIVTKLVTY